MKLADWARKNGIDYKTAYRMFRAGTLPVRSEQFATGTIVVHLDEPVTRRVVLYGRVSSHDQKADLARQMERLRAFCSSRGWIVAGEVVDLASGLNGKRTGLSRLLSDRTATDIVVEHRDRLARFGFEMVEAALAASDRRLHVVNDTEFKDDLVRDFVEVVTSMCARIYGRRAAKNRAKRAVEAAAK